MNDNNFTFKNEITSNINYWLHIIEAAKEGGDIYLKSLNVDESNIAKAFGAGISLPQSFGISINLICQISPPLTSGPRIDEWITLISAAITYIPREYENKLSVLHNLLAQLYIRTNHLSQAYDSYNQAHSHASIENNIRELGIAKLGIARHFLQSKQYELAIANVRGAIREMEGEKSLMRMIAAAWNMLGVISIHKHNFQEAERFFSRVIKMYSAKTIDAQYALTLGNLAMVLEQDEKPLDCLRYLARCRRILVNHHSDSHLHQIDYLFGLTFMKLDMWDKAQRSFIRAISFSLQKFPDAPMLSHLYECLGISCLKIGKIGTGLHYLKKSLQISIDLAQITLPQHSFSC